ncbi:MAG: enoyl-CoA hydratase/isomerase family protein [Acidimicrobiales bacterium]
MTTSEQTTNAEQVVVAEEPASVAPEVLYEADGRVATVRLNRPHRRNAISFRMLAELTEALRRAEADDDVRCVVLTGAGKGFCSGLDIKDAMAGTGIGGSSGSIEPQGIEIADLPTVVLQEMDTPVICAVNGAAAGYGLDLALGCDLRIGSASTRLLPGFAKRGVVPESGGTWYLPRLVGWSTACRIAMLGRDLDAAEARDLGLLDEVVDDDEQLLDTARSWADEIAANAPLAIRAMKRLFREGLTEDFRTHSEKVLAETVRLFGTADFMEGITAFVEGRPPDFTGR